ncbi:hypothetical protein N657DRAFT_633657 [Parathielavia appendiculata]|uniref:Uncharacterized protein n=1 Tax=Parathielavia appendiculata TaxID=2587402 RepID=A0AAN6U1D3_9PEZI|nr:hypothetical protein N657DRAFT_633657 [Parathielavia appendiculata]
MSESSLTSKFITSAALEAPKEFSGVSQSLTEHRRENAESGALHPTARKLRALFDGVSPLVPELLGKRVSEICDTQNIDPIDLWAAATSGTNAIAVHLLASMIAEVFDDVHAVSIRWELIERRKVEIQQTIDKEPNQIKSMAMALATKQEFSRAEIAMWTTAVGLERRNDIHQRVVKGILQKVRNGAILLAMNARIYTQIFTVTQRVSFSLSRICMDDFRHVLLGDRPKMARLSLAEMHKITSKTSWIGQLLSAAEDFAEGSELEQDTARKLIEHGRRHGAFLCDAGSQPAPFLAVAHSLVVLSPHGNPEPRIAYLRQYAKDMGLSNGNCLIRYYYSGTLYEYASLEPISADFEPHEQGHGGTNYVSLDFCAGDQKSALIVMTGLMTESNTDPRKGRPGSGTREAGLFLERNTIKQAFRPQDFDYLKLTEWFTTNFRFRHSIFVRSLRACAAAVEMYGRLPDTTVTSSIVSSISLLWARWIPEREPPNASPLRVKISGPEAFACITMFDSGALIDPAYLQHPGLSFLVPAPEPLVRKAKQEAWTLLSHNGFSGAIQDSFGKTSMHLRLTQYKPELHGLYQDKHYIDECMALRETLVQVYDGGDWRPVKGQSPLSHMVTVDHWEELLTPPTDQAISVVRAAGNWLGRFAAAGVSIRLQRPTVVLPPEDVCWECVDKHIQQMGLVDEVRRIVLIM